jgi:hypothetical protein
MDDGFLMYTHYVKQELCLGAGFLNFPHLAFHQQKEIISREREREGEEREREK